jgi:hypothetical protein
MDTTQEVSQVRRKAKILVYTVSIIVLAQIAIALIISSSALEKVSVLRQSDLEKAFENYMDVVYAQLDGSVYGYAYWSEICDTLNKTGRIPSELAGSWLKGNADVVYVFGLEADSLLYTINLTPGACPTAMAWIKVE